MTAVVVHEPPSAPPLAPPPAAPPAYPPVSPGAITRHFTQFDLSIPDVSRRRNLQTEEGESQGPPITSTRAQVVIAGFIGDLLDFITQGMVVVTLTDGVLSARVEGHCDQLKVPLMGLMADLVDYLSHELGTTVTFIRIWCPMEVYAAPSSPPPLPPPPPLPFSPPPPSLPPSRPVLSPSPFPVYPPAFPPYEPASRPPFYLPPFPPIGTEETDEGVTESLSSLTEDGVQLWIILLAALLMCCCLCCGLLLYLLARRQPRGEKQSDNELEVSQVTLNITPIPPPLYGPQLRSLSRGLSNRVLELRREMSGALPVEEQAVSTPLMELEVSQEVLEVPGCASSGLPAAEQPTAPTRRTSGCSPSSSRRASMRI